MRVFDDFSRIFLNKVCIFFFRLHNVPIEWLLHSHHIPLRLPAECHSASRFQRPSTSVGQLLPPPTRADHKLRNTSERILVVRSIRPLPLVSTTITESSRTVARQQSHQLWLWSTAVSAHYTPTLCTETLERWWRDKDSGFSRLLPAAAGSGSRIKFWSWPVGTQRVSDARSVLQSNTHGMEQRESSWPPTSRSSLLGLLLRYLFE